MKRSQMKIVFLDRITLGEDVSIEKFKKFGEVVVYQTTRMMDVNSHIKDADIVVTNKVIIDKKAMDNARKLKLICVAATGMNNIDLEYAKKKGIEVKNVKGYSTDSVVQHTFSMLFYLLEKLRYYDMYVKSGVWSKSGVFTCLDRPFFEIKGKRWGIIGLGTIGKEVARVARAFGSEVVYYSTSGKNDNNEYERLSLDELLKTSDIISIHAPLNENTKNLLDFEKLSLIKKGALLLNLGRGGIINEKDLSEILSEGRIFAGLDVLEKEPIEEENPLLHISHGDNLLITPHIAWTSIEARRKLVDGIYNNIKEFLQKGGDVK